MIKAIRGTRDILPPESEAFQEAEAAARAVFGSYGFAEIRTPIFEATQLFARSVGEETDIVSKEMYTFLDRDETSLTLRPEATASVVRAYIEHRLWERPGLTRLYYMGPMFRRERPQKGRYRQFSQIGAEVLGSDDPQVDYELLEMLVALLDRCGISGWELVLNSIGCPHDRPRYYEALRQALAPELPHMCADCRRRAETNPLRVLDCKVPDDQPVIAKLPAIGDYLDEPCRAHYARVRELLDKGGIRYRPEPRLVRGLDYYTRTAFEFVHGALGAQNALLGGGRYDGLAQALGAPAEVGAGIGFAIGEDRFVTAMLAGREPASEPAGPLAAGQVRVYIVPLGAEMQAEALKLARELRTSGIATAVGESGRRIGKLLETAGRAGARYAVIIGEKEVAAGEVAVKDLSTGGQKTLPRAELLSYLKL
jgi:histidyl-tRNA synthetase